MWGCRRGYVDDQTLWRCSRAGYLSRERGDQEVRTAIRVLRVEDQVRVADEDATSSKEVEIAAPIYPGPPGQIRGGGITLFDRFRLFSACPQTVTRRVGLAFDPRMTERREKQV